MMELLRGPERVQSELDCGSVEDSLTMSQTASSILARVWEPEP